jgi:GNAT superfamily N-acetyltransferase
MTTEQPDEIPHVVRPAEPDERRFISETTAKVRQPSGVPWRTWEPVGRSLAESAMRGVTLVVDAGGVVLGFVVVLHGIVEMLYVKQRFRGEGFGRELLTAAGVAEPIPVRVTTGSWRAWCRGRGIRWEVVRDQEEVA